MSFAELVTQTVVMFALRRWAPTVLLASFSLGCQREKTPPAPPTGAERPVETESPNARILPEPLPDAELEAATDSLDSRDAIEPAEEAPPPRIPLPLVGPVRSEAVLSGQGSGMVLLGTFAWPPARGVVRTRGEAEAAWPTMQIELTPGFREQPGRARLILTSRVWGLPVGTELRGRSDVKGFIVVWPDDRSYRVVPQGAVRALFEERRVDTMPLVPLSVSELGAGKRLGRPTRKLLAEGPVGSLRLDLVEVPESGIESSLLCDFFFGMVRAETPAGVCAGGELPVFVDIQSPGSGSLQFSISEMSLRTDLRRSSFMVPPDLSIFKPGELPPGEPLLWDPETLSQIVATAEEGPQLSFRNHHDVPLYLIVDSVPVSRIDPGQEIIWRPGPGEHRHAARDFLGQILEPGGIAQAPAEVHYGKPLAEEEFP